MSNAELAQSLVVGLDESRRTDGLSSRELKANDGRNTGLIPASPDHTHDFRRIARRTIPRSLSLRPSYPHVFLDLVSLRTVSIMRDICVDNSSIPPTLIRKGGSESIMDKRNIGDYPTGFAIGEMRTEEKKRAAKSFGARCGHVKRHLRQGDPLTGNTLDLALDYAQDDKVARKLKAGEELSEYEYHVLVEVLLLHVRLSS